MAIVIKKERNLHRVVRDLASEVIRCEQKIEELREDYRKRLEMYRQRVYRSFLKKFKKYRVRPVLACLFFAFAAAAAAWGGLFFHLSIATGAAFFLIKPLWWSMFWTRWHEGLPFPGRQIERLQRELEEKKAQYKGWRKGLQGELLVAQKLETELPDAFYVAHDVYIKTKTHGSSQIDHVVVGPTGVFCLETKTISGRFYPADEGWLRYPFKPGKSAGAKRPETMPSPQLQAQNSGECLKAFLAQRGIDVDVRRMVVLAERHSRWMAPENKGGVPVVHVDKLARKIAGSTPRSERLSEQTTRRVIFALPLG